jgi:putative spermidine/putrescine transport system ATP-binding protein
MAYLELKGVRKVFRGHVALESFTLAVEEGEMMCLLGPSGCGKTTTLRVVAGFEAPDAGEVRLAGADITGVPAQRRDIGIVFQSYALFPHLTVNENVGFGLAMRGRPRADIESEVREALKVVRLDGVGERLPRQLSGGQQQRVALARAIAIRPRLLLLDEPLSNLDAKLRDEMREEIKRIQRAVGITAVFVTHDQLEALALADRLAVMDQGRLVQVDAPVNVYERPGHPFVASFFGQANLLRGRVAEAQGESVRIETHGGLSVIGRGGRLSAGDAVVGVVKHERVQLVRTRPLAVSNAFAAKVESRTFLGATVQFLCSAAGERIGVTQPNTPGAENFVPGDQAFVCWADDDCLAMPDHA